MNDYQKILDDYTYSLSQIADEADVSATTVRKYINKRYADIFPAYKPDDAIYDKYPPVAVDMVKRIYHLSTVESKEASEIKPIIENEFKLELAKYRSVVAGEVDEPTQGELAHSRAPSTPHNTLPPHTQLTLYNDHLVQSALASMENYQRWLKIKDEEIQILVQELAQKEGAVTTLENELIDRERDIEDLENQLEATRKELEEERQKYGLLGIWKKKDSD